MKNLLKDIAVLLFSAGDEIERKAEEFKKERKERYEKFENELKEAKDNIAAKFGVASTGQIDELKKQIEELSKKIDKIHG